MSISWRPSGPSSRSKQSTRMARSGNHVCWSSASDTSIYSASTSTTYCPAPTATSFSRRCSDSTVLCAQSPALLRPRRRRIDTLSRGSVRTRQQFQLLSEDGNLCLQPVHDRLQDDGEIADALGLLLLRFAAW